MKKAIWAYKKSRDIYRRTDAFAGEVERAHPKFSDESKAALAKGPIKSGKIGSVNDRKTIPAVEYDKEDDRAIEDFVRSKIQTTWHGLGTCKMAPKEKGGVTDKSLNVYGTQRLKCCGKSYNYTFPDVQADALSQIFPSYRRTLLQTQTILHLS